MAYVPYSPKIGDIYVLSNGAGNRAVFNNPADADYVGVLSDVTGLDSAEVRESSEDLPSADGGQHGLFYYGRRPITMTGLLYDHSTEQIRDARFDKIKRASNALRADATLSWKPKRSLTGATDFIEMYTPVRRQQPLRLSGNWIKEFQIALVSEYTPLFSVQLYSLSGSPVVCENHGDYPMLPIITVTGATPTTVVTNAANGKTLRFSPATTGAPTVVTDLSTRQATVGGTLRNDLLDFVNSTWPSVDMGNNSFSITGGGTLNVQWRDAWS